MLPRPRGTYPLAAALPLFDLGFRVRGTRSLALNESWKEVFLVLEFMRLLVRGARALALRKSVVSVFESGGALLVAVPPGVVGKVFGPTFSGDPGIVVNPGGGGGTSWIRNGVNVTLLSALGAAEDSVACVVVESFGRL